MWVRGLKQPFQTAFVPVYPVAPRVGAWIETAKYSVCPSASTSHPVWVRGLKPYNMLHNLHFARSHPVWVRGLKHSEYGSVPSILQSHPVWVRGLKPHMAITLAMLAAVAPRVGAWIETFLS